MSKNALCWQDSKALIRAINWYACVQNDLTYQVDEMHIAIFLNVLNFEGMKFGDKYTKKFL